MSQREAATGPAHDPAVRAALQELQHYLSDAMAPLMVTDAVEVLLKYPPSIVASGIHSWMTSQYRGGAGDPVSDYLFHAMKKIHAMSEFRLIEKERLDAYLKELGSIVLAFAPAGEREALGTSIRNLGQADAALAPTLEILHRQAGKPPAGPPAAGGSAVSTAVSAEMARGLKRFSVLMDRLGEPDGTVAGPRGELVTQILATAAVNSRTGADLERYMARLSERGIDARMDQVFRALSRSLPAWAADGGRGKDSVPQSRPAQAMYRIVSSAGDPQEGGRRFNEMIQAASEQFNEGFLARAVTMFGLAEQLVAEKKLDPELARTILQRAHTALASGQLRQLADRPEKHPMLRKVLFFFPALTPQGLLADLLDEPKRDRRKLLVALLQAYGAEARPLILEKLEACLSGTIPDDQGQYQRNLLYLLRHIPREAETPWERELQILNELTKPGRPPVLIKEGIGALGQLRNEAAEKSLQARLNEFEEILIQGKCAQEDAAEILLALDRAVAALARHGTRNAFRLVVNHALRTESQLGDTLARAQELSGHDLSGDAELVKHLLEALKQALPRKVLVFTRQRNAEGAVYLVRALSGTHAPAAREALQDIASRFSGQELGEAASRALAEHSPRPAGSGARPASAAPGLSGDLELFGLPNLFQTIADSRMTGLLTLSAPDGRPLGSVTFESGRILDGQAGHLRAECAVYQLFESPGPGSFSFASRPPSAGKEDAGHEVTSTLLEALRRHDELQQARILVADDATLEATETKPGRPPDEEDEALVKVVWTRAKSGQSPATCEADLPVDSFRIRRLFSFWVEEGALKLK